MAYLELSRKAEETIRTLIEFTFPDNTKTKIDIPHFNPSSEEDITTGIKNRMISEWREIIKDEEEVKKLATELGITIK